MATLTLTATYNAHAPRMPRLPLLRWIILFAAAAAGLVLCAHALKHTLSERVLNCPDGNIVMRLINPYTGRKAIVCEYEPGQFGRIICEGKNCVTSYANAKRPSMNTLEVAIRHLRNGGYKTIEFVRPDMMDAIARILAAIP